MKQEPNPTGRPSTADGPWLDLVNAVGGVAELAKLLEVTEMTVWRWAHGRTVPMKIVQNRVNELARRRGLKAPFK